MLDPPGIHTHLSNTGQWCYRSSATAVLLPQLCYRNFAKHTVAYAQAVQVTKC